MPRPPFRTEIPSENNLLEALLTSNKTASDEQSLNLGGIIDQREGLSKAMRGKILTQALYSHSLEVLLMDRWARTFNLDKGLQEYAASNGFIEQKGFESICAALDETFQGIEPSEYEKIKKFLLTGDLVNNFEKGYAAYRDFSALQDDASSCKSDVKDKMEACHKALLATLNRLGQLSPQRNRNQGRTITPKSSTSFGQCPSTPTDNSELQASGSASGSQGTPNTSSARRKKLRQSGLLYQQSIPSAIAPSNSTDSLWEGAAPASPLAGKLPRTLGSPLPKAQKEAMSDQEAALRNAFVQGRNQYKKEADQAIYEAQTESQSAISMLNDALKEKETKEKELAVSTDENKKLKQEVADLYSETDRLGVIVRRAKEEVSMLEKEQQQSGHQRTKSEKNLEKDKKKLERSLQKLEEDKKRLAENYSNLQAEFETQRRETQEYQTTITSLTPKAEEAKEVEAYLSSIGGSIESLPSTSSGAKTLFKSRGSLGARVKRIVTDNNQLKEQLDHAQSMIPETSYYIEKLQTALEYIRSEAINSASETQIECASVRVLAQLAQDLPKFSETVDTLLAKFGTLQARQDSLENAHAARSAELDKGDLYTPFSSRRRSRPSLTGSTSFGIDRASSPLPFRHSASAGFPFSPATRPSSPASPYLRNFDRSLSEDTATTIPELDSEKVCTSNAYEDIQYQLKTLKNQLVTLSNLQQSKVLLTDTESQELMRKIDELKSLAGPLGALQTLADALNTDLKELEAAYRISELKRSIKDIGKYAHQFISLWLALAIFENLKYQAAPYLAFKEDETSSNARAVNELKREISKTASRLTVSGDKRAKNTPDIAVPWLKVTAEFESAYQKLDFFKQSAQFEWGNSRLEISNKTLSEEEKEQATLEFYYQETNLNQSELEMEESIRFLAHAIIATAEKTPGMIVALEGKGAAVTKLTDYLYFAKALYEKDGEELSFVIKAPQLGRRPVSSKEQLEEIRKEIFRGIAVVDIVDQATCATQHNLATELAGLGETDLSCNSSVVLGY